VLFVLKINGIFEKRKSQPKELKGDYFLYTGGKTGTHVPVFSLFLLR